MDDELQKSASGVLWRRYVGTDPDRAAAVERERVNAEVAQMLYDRRTAAGLTQKQLADLIGTRQSVISRLEDADYDGHSLRMLQRIAEALDQRVHVDMTPADPKSEVIRFAFREVMRALRRKKGLSLDQLATQLDVEREELARIERQEGCRPSLLLLQKLSRFYKIPHRKLTELAGVAHPAESGLRAQASRFAAHAEALTTLTAEESRMVDDFVTYLRAEA